MCVCMHYAGCVGKAIVVFGPSSRDREIVDNLCRDDADTHSQSANVCVYVCLL